MVSRLLLLAALVPFAAQGEPVNGADAAALQIRLRDAIGSLGGLAPPLIVTPEDDHYRIALPLDGILTQPLSLAARPLGGSRWDLTDLRMPPALDAQPDVKNPAGAMVLSGTVDLDLATPSAVTLEGRDLQYTHVQDGQRQTQIFGRYRIDTTLTPADAGSVDLRQTIEVDNWRTTAVLPNGTRTQVSVGSLHASGQADGLAPAALGQARDAIALFLADGMPQQDQHDLTDSQRAGMRALIQALRHALTGMTADETLHDVAVSLTGMGEARIRTIRLGMGGQAPDGRLRSWIDMAIEGVSVPSLPPAFARYIPSRIELRPSLNGILLDDAMGLALAATEEDADRDLLMSNAEALFAADSVQLGLDNIRIDLAPLELTGSARIRMLAANLPGIEAHLSAAGLDAMISQAKQDPMLQQALPVLVMLRGLGRPEGRGLTWDVSASGGQVMVNGMDVTKMGGPEPHQPAGKKPPRR